MSAHTLLHGDVSLTVDGTLRLLQITDTHLMSEPGGRLLNVDTDDSLGAVVDLATVGNHNPHALLITGDIAGDGGSDAYYRLERALEPLAAQSYWLPGNHDGCDGAEVAAERFTRFLSSPHWLVVMLNSQVADEVGGHLEPAELDALARAVDDANQTSRHLLVALHHPLWPLGCDWLDPQRIDNASALQAEVARATHRVLVLSGHVHQESDMTVDGVRYLTSPSTCVQFAPGETDFKVDTLGPGYRWIELDPDGSVRTAVERVVDREFPVDLDSGGYL